MIIAYFDGSFSPEKPIQIGYCFLIKNINKDEITYIKYGNENLSNSNSAVSELISIFYLMKYLEFKRYQSVKIYGDSEYVVNAFNKKIRVYKSQDIWEIIHNIKNKNNDIKMYHIPRCSNKFASICDVLARSALLNNLHN